MQQLDEKGEVDVLKVVSTMRQDRGGMVQTKEQYLFLYQVRRCLRFFYQLLLNFACTQVLLEYSKYLDELRSPYKTASTSEVVRPPRVTFGGRLETQREEDEESTSTT